MTVAQLVSLFETIDRRAQADIPRKTNRPPRVNHSRQPSTACSSGNIDAVLFMSSRTMKLSLHTMFHHDRSQSRSRSSRSGDSRTPSNARSPATAVSPSPAYPFLSRPYTPTGSPYNSGLLSPSSSTNTSPSSSLSSRPYIRRQPSAVDLALEEERSAVGAENIGLGLLEPRPRAASSGSVRLATTHGEGMCSLMEVLGESRRGTPEVVALDGIFEVLERGR